MLASMFCRKCSMCVQALTFTPVVPPTSPKAIFGGIFGSQRAFIQLDLTGSTGSRSFRKVAGVGSMFGELKNNHAMATKAFHGPTVRSVPPESLWCRTVALRAVLAPASFQRRAVSTSQGAQTPSSVKTLPLAIQPYALLARLDKPIGTWLLLWPCLWSIAIVAPAGALPNLWMMTKFSIGAFVMRGAGCTINDLWDMDIDSKVERTKTRPLAAGLITKEQAVVFLGLQLSAGLAVLLSLNMYSIALGAASMGLVVIYPLMKRVTYWPQLVLGLTFNWGALLGASAVLGACPWHICLPMYGGCVAWTLMYDTIYAHQDKADDVKVGVKSTALLLQNQTKPALLAFSTCFLGGLLGAGSAAGMGAVYYGAVTAVGGHLAWQIRTVDLDNPADCMAKFVSNSQLGALLCAGIVLDRLVPLSILALWPW